MKRCILFGLVLLGLFGFVGCSDDAGNGDGGPGDGPVNTDADGSTTTDQPTTTDKDGSSGTDLPVCDEIEIGSGKVAPNMMLVVDKSGSMNDPPSAGSSRTKLQDTVDALNMLLNDGENEIRFGWMQFPSDNECGPGTVAIDIGDSTVPQIRNLVNNLVASGGTPTGETLENALAAPGLYDEQRNNFIVLLTDGQPTCPVGNGRTVTPEDCNRALQAVKDLHTANIDTFVIGLGDDLNASNPELLNNMAIEGGRARAGAIKYYQANSLAALQEVFQEIGGMVIGCNLSLDSVPEYPAYLWVYFDEVLLNRDPNHVNGWDYDPDRNQINFYGPACDRLRAGEVGKVEIIMGCRPPD